MIPIQNQRLGHCGMGKVVGVTGVSLNLVHPGNHVRTVPHKFPSPRKPVHNLLTLGNNFNKSSLS